MIVSIETDAGTYQHPFEFTIEGAARQFAEDLWEIACPRIGKYIVTIAVMSSEAVLDVYDGQWFSDRGYWDWLDEQSAVDCYVKGASL